MAAHDSCSDSLDIATLHALYRDGTLKPSQLIETVLQRIRENDGDHVWISLADEAEVRENAARLDALLGDDDAFINKPLLGIPFAVKDNIDVAGIETTAAFPALDRHPTESATVVKQLLDAGAIFIGKTNMDQFATGLLGTRSPYGTPVNPFDPACIPGGSSSGSAVAVSKGLVSFSLGTDTAGSGRVPAFFNNIVGLKPSRGVVSTRGVVPAVRTLDCVSIFSLTCDDAALIANVITAFDALDDYSRAHPQQGRIQRRATGVAQLAIPAAADMRFFGSHADTLRRSFDAVTARLRKAGHRVTEISYSPFVEAAKLLYQGPWIAERRIAFGRYLDTDSSTIDRSVLTAVNNGRDYSAEDLFHCLYKLQALRREVERNLIDIDALLVPTVGARYALDELDPYDNEANANLGYYTNFLNLLDLSAIAVPAGFSDDGLPFGVSLIAPAFEENRLLSLGDDIHRLLSDTTGATGIALPPRPEVAPVSEPQTTRLCVVGAHMRGLGLNHQLTEAGAKYLYSARTSDQYRLYHLTRFAPPRPGLVRTEPGVSQEIEVWEIPFEGFGRFVDIVNAPLVIGTVTLEDGSNVKGFLCEAWATAQAEDISRYGGWRGYLASR